MNPLSFITRPVSDLSQAIFMPFKALFVIGLTGFINAMTYNGSWWFKWVAFGMGIAVLVSQVLQALRRPAPAVSPGTASG